MDTDISHAVEERLAAIEERLTALEGGPTEEVPPEEEPETQPYPQTQE